MVFVKVREVYDLHTVQGKMSVIGIHTPNPEIIVRNYPGLLMQCKAYRPVSCDVKLACASMLPADPLQVGTSTGDIAPEDLFNPILYKATSNFGMSLIESRIYGIMNNVYAGADVNGSSAVVDNDSLTPSSADEFDLYYGLLSDTHGWRHANPQAGLEMNDLKPLVYEIVQNFGDNSSIVQNMPTTVSSPYVSAVDGTSGAITTSLSTAGTQTFRGSSKPMPWLNCSYPKVATAEPGFNQAGSSVTNIPQNKMQGVPWAKIMCGCIIVPPSRLHQLFYRMVCEWTIEFSGIRSIQEITDFDGLRALGANSHYQTYDYSTTSKALGVEASTMSNDSTMVSANVDINKVM